MFLWWCHVLNFSYSWKSYVVLFTFEEGVTSSVLLTGFGREIIFLLPVWDSKSFLSFSMYIPAPHILFTSWKKFLRLSDLSQSCVPRPNAYNFLLAFPKMLLVAQVYLLSPNPAESGQLSAHACLPFAKACCLYPGDMHRQPCIQ